MSTPENFINELEELPWKFHDRSKHFYHPGTNRVYSQYTSSEKKGKWYISPNAESMRFRYFNPSEYRKKQEEAEQKEIERKRKYREYAMNRWDNGDTVLRRHEDNNGVLILSKSLIEDLIDNKLFYVGKYFIWDTRDMEFENMELEGNERGNPDKIYTVGEGGLGDKDLFPFDLFWDFKPPKGEEELYIEIDGVSIRLYSNAVLPIGILSYRTISIPPGTSFRKMVLSRGLRDDLRSRRLVSKNGDQKKLVVSTYPSILREA